MSEKTKSQRLADFLGYMPIAFPTQLEAAAELRRLDALNAELMAALEFVIRGVPNTWEGVQKAREVIRKAKEQT